MLPWSQLGYGKRPLPDGDDDAATGKSPDPAASDPVAVDDQENAVLCNRGVCSEAVEQKEYQGATGFYVLDVIWRT